MSIRFKLGDLVKLSERGQRHGQLTMFSTSVGYNLLKDVHAVNLRNDVGEVVVSESYGNLTVWYPTHKGYIKLPARDYQLYNED